MMPADLLALPLEPPSTEPEPPLSEADQLAIYGLHQCDRCARILAERWLEPTPQGWWRCWDRGDCDQALVQRVWAGYSLFLTAPPRAEETPQPPRRRKSRVLA